MSESKSPVFRFEGDDPDMLQAYQDARASFRYFWRELFWEYHRIVPALDMSAVKAPFSDGPNAPRPKNQPEVEQMWMSDVQFDGRVVSGELINAPNWVKSVKQGDSVRVPLDEISDWMYAIDGQVFGAYTVNVLRAKMNPAERKEHDAAWGLNFGDPSKIRVIPEPKKGRGLLGNWFGKQTPANMDDDHPMSVSMATSLKDQIAKDPSMLTSKSDEGWTLLHQVALGGSESNVKVLLEAGADRNALTNDGRTALQLAQSLGWDRVVALLQGK